MKSMLWGVCYRQSLNVFTRIALGLLVTLLSALPFAAFGATVEISTPLPPPTSTSSVSLIVTNLDGSQQLVPLQPTDKNGTSLANLPPLELNIASVPTYKFSITTTNSSLTTTTLREINLTTGDKLNIPLNYFMAIVPGGPDEAEPGDGASPAGPAAPGPTTATLSPRNETPPPLTTRTFSAPEGMGLNVGSYQVILPVPGRGETLYFGAVLAGVLTGNGLENPVTGRHGSDKVISSPGSPSGYNATSARPGCSLSVGSPTVNLFSGVWMAMTMSLLLGLALRIRRNHNKA